LPHRFGQSGGRRIVTKQAWIIPKRRRRVKIGPDPVTRARDNGLRRKRHQRGRHDPADCAHIAMPRIDRLMRAHLAKHPFGQRPGNGHDRTGLIIDHAHRHRCTDQKIIIVQPQRAMAISVDKPRPAKRTRGHLNELLLLGSRSIHQLYLRRAGASLKTINWFTK
jgi:hypothetical protein